MFFAVGVTAEASTAFGTRRHFTVAGVTARAVLMLRFLVQARKHARLMAARTRGGPSHARRAMRAVTGGAGLYALTMRGLRFRGMAAGTADFRRRSAVRLVAALAILVTQRCALVFLRVTVLATDPERSAVWLVAARALGVAAAHFRVLPRVARITGLCEGFGSMWQAGVAVLASVVPAHRDDQRELFGVTGVAARFVGQGTHEVVGFVALLAVGAAVEILVRACDLVTTAAIA